MNIYSGMSCAFHNYGRKARPFEVGQCVGLNGAPSLSQPRRSEGQVITLVYRGPVDPICRINVFAITNCKRYIRC